jgi:multidrug efflux pump subunit AcrB
VSPVQERGVIAWMAANPVAANLLMLVVMVAGLQGLFGITKEVFPSFPSETFTVTVPYPGSSPEEVEEGILIKIEEAIQDIVGIDEIRSVAREGVGVVTVKVEAGGDVTRVLNQAKVRVDGIASFPNDAEEPIVEEIISSTRAMNLSLFGDIGEHELKELADELRDEVLALPGITQVELRGDREYEISIELSEHRLLEYGLDFGRVVDLIQDRSRDLPGGKVRTEQGAIVLRSVGQAYTGEEYADLVLLSRGDGTRIRLGDIAAVRDEFEDQPVLTRMNQRQAVTLVVDRVGEQNVLDMTDRLRAYVAERSATLPPGVELTAWADTSRILNGRINLLLKSALQGTALVILTLTLFLDLRLAFWVIIGVPFSFLGALAVIHFLGLPISINVLSLFAFILVLGILVDDGIVTAESAYAQLESERQGVDSIVRGVRRVAVATIFGAMTTMIAFAPMAFLDEGFARAMTHISPVVILCLAFSLLETKLILPAHLRHLRPDVDTRRLPGWRSRLTATQRRIASSLTDFANGPYRRALARAVRNRYLTLAGFLAALIVIAALLPAGLVRFIFFPNVPSDFINVDLQMPQGTSWQTTHEYALRLEEAAYAMDARYRETTGRDDSVIEEVMVQSADDTEASLTVELIKSTERDITSVELAGWLREAVGELSGVQALSIDANAGPSGSPIDVELSSPDIDELRQAADELKSALMGFDGVFDLRDTFNAGGPELDIRLTREGEALGLGQVELARQVRRAFFGAEVQRVQRGRHEVRVYVRFPESQRSELDTLKDMWIRLPDGRRVPFAVVGEARERIGVSTINRFNRKRVVNVLGNVDKSRVEPGEVNAAIVDELLPPILERHPGVSARLSGEAEAQAETGRTLLLGLVAILLMIYAALAIPLKSYLQPLIIMAVIPFGLGGAVLGHFLLGKEVSILSIIGMLGLVGVVVNDSLVLVDYINHRIGEGRHWAEAVLDAGVRRFRAVVLTSVTTFVGLLPIQLETSIQSNFVKPMAISVAFGVLFSTVITLLLVPSLYYIGRDLHDLLTPRRRGVQTAS